MQCQYQNNRQKHKIFYNIQIDDQINMNQNKTATFFILELIFVQQKICSMKILRTLIHLLRK